jgi:hypothetical protein
LGLLALTVSVAVYNTLSNIPFVPPVNPGPTAIIPAVATAAQISNLCRLHAEALNRFREYLATDKALKQQLITAIQPIYLLALSHRITGFANVTTRQMLVHLYANYGRLSPADLQANDTTMKERYDANQPIKTLFDQIKNSIDIADAATALYSPEQIVNIAYTLVFATGMFPEACRDWRRLPTVDKTWIRLKTDLAIAHQEFHDSQLTAHQTGYHSANTIQVDVNAMAQTADALANLATATASGRTTFAISLQPMPASRMSFPPSTANSTQLLPRSPSSNFAANATKAPPATRKPEHIHPRTTTVGRMDTRLAKTAPAKAVPTPPLDTTLVLPKPTTWAALNVAKNDGVGADT